MDNDREIKMRAGKDSFNPFSDKINLFYIENVGKQYSAADNLHMKTLGEDGCAPNFCTLSKSQAQLLMDDLWNCGLRPSEGTGSAGAMKAVQDHLADLKKILFKTLKVNE